MLVFAHAGHWLPQLISLVPLLVLIGVIMTGRIRDRREAAQEAGPEGAHEQGRADRDDGGLDGGGGGYSRRVSRDELFVLWSAARAEANMAYDAWCDAP